MTLAAYERHRRIYEALLLLAVVVFGCLSNVAVEWVDHGREGAPFNPALPWVLEVSSHLALLVMLLPLVVFDRAFALTRDTWRRALPAHLAFSVVFSLGHVLLMYAFRVWAFPVFVGQDYRWESWFGEFLYEYIKDFRTYFYFLAFIYLYRFVLRRIQGEAGFVADRDATDEESLADRFLVKKLGREFLVRTADIDWIESSGNYVNLHVQDRVYPMRGTMRNTAERLAGRGFARVHRQAIVNLDRVSEIRVQSTGDGELTLAGGAIVPVSRRFRQALKDRLEA